MKKEIEKEKNKEKNKEKKKEKKKEKEKDIIPCVGWTGFGCWIWGCWGCCGCKVWVGACCGGCCGFCCESWARKIFLSAALTSLLPDLIVNLKKLVS